MGDYEKLLKLADGEEVCLADSFKELLGTELVLGQTRYVCRYGTLSDGHEKITPSQMYYQAIKEMWLLRGNIKLTKAQAMMAHADLLDAEEKLINAKSKSEKIRAEAQIIQANEKIITSLVTVEDQTRMIDEYNKVRAELAPRVRSQYPLGIEQSEADNWKAVFEYRMKKGGGIGYGERVDNVPLDPLTKARLGVRYNRPDATAPLETAQAQAIGAFSGGDIRRFVGLVEHNEAVKEAKDGQICEQNGT